MSRAPIPIAQIALDARAPVKPPLGAPCNGCGICCAAEPCPVSRLLLRHRAGPCPALQWSAPESRYRCGMVDAPLRYLPLPLPRSLAPMLTRVFARWICAGQGCDSDAEVIDDENATPRA